ncbi:MAG TPA: MATE family efflux transporter [Flavobacteriaceae bacterium]|nr:MATE family efflux transporter [Flavobacteriaceae bacterium]
MQENKASYLGELSIWRLLYKQGLPASIGILVLSLNIVIDTMFVGNFIGPDAIGAINVVLPIAFFISALGLAIGVGGGSIISRALGANDFSLANRTFGNQVTLTFLLTAVMAVFGLVFTETLIPIFGGKGSLYGLAETYYKIVLYGVPIQGLVMMGNNVMRAEGNPKNAMIAMIIPSVTNLLMDYILIVHYDFGMAGAGWATVSSYILSVVYIGWYYLSGTSQVRVRWRYLKLRWKVVKEVIALGTVTLARQAMVSVTYLMLNNILFSLGGETSVTVYGIIGRMLMFALFPVIGVTHGFLPIAGYNYGAKLFGRVKETIWKAILAACGLGLLVFLFIGFYPETIVSAFTQDATLLEKTPNAMRIVFAATPIIGIQLIGAAYFQAVGKAVPALLLTLTRQGFFFIPLLFILPNYYGELGVWLSFPLSDLISTIVTGLYMRREVRRKLLVK